MYNGQSTKKQTASQPKNIQQQTANTNQETKESATDAIVEGTEQKKVIAKETPVVNTKGDPYSEYGGSAHKQNSIGISSADGNSTAVQKEDLKFVSANNSLD
jgi:hypothetical protein